MAKVGFVPVDTTGKWIGGRYYLQHLIKCVAALSGPERLDMCDVWWKKKEDEDPFREVREHLAESAIIDFPNGLGRLRRKIRQTLAGSRDARDLFYEAGISVLFPIQPCDSPGVPFVFWLPDFQHRYYPQYYPEDMLRWYEEFFDANVAKASLVVLSSQHALMDYQRIYPRSVQKARVLRFCSVPQDSWWQLDPDSVAKAKGIKGQFVIASNQFSHNKNHQVIFEAMRILRDNGENIKLVCTGSLYGFRGSDYIERLRAFVSDHKLCNTILIFGFLPRGEQIALTRRAACVLQPSRFEGWSTVIEDAKSLNKEILASNIPVHREQLTEVNCATLLPLDDPAAWAEAISASVATSESKKQRNLCGPKLADRITSTGRSFVGLMHEAISGAN